MTTLGHARRLTKKALARDLKRIRRLVALEMLIDTLLIALTALALSLWPAQSLLLPAAAFLITLTSLVMQFPLTNAARKSNGHAPKPISFGRLALLCPLALPAAGLTALVQALVSVFMTEWTSVVPLLLGSTLNLVLLLAGLVLFILLAAFVSVLTRQLALGLCEGVSLSGSGLFTHALKTALCRILCPCALFFSALGWFTLAFVLMSALVIGLCLLTTPIMTDAGLTMLALQLLAALFALPVWGWAAALILGGFWTLGLSLIYRPRYEMTRLYWHRLTLKNADLL